MSSSAGQVFYGVKGIAVMSSFRSRTYAIRVLSIKGVGGMLGEAVGSSGIVSLVYHVDVWGQRICHSGQRDG